MKLEVFDIVLNLATVTAGLPKNVARQIKQNSHELKLKERENGKKELKVSSNIYHNMKNRYILNSETRKNELKIRNSCIYPKNKQHPLEDYNNIDDYACGDKCCFDICLNEHVCRIPIG